MNLQLGFLCGAGEATEPTSRILGGGCRRQGFPVTPPLDSPVYTPDCARTKVTLWRTTYALSASPFRHRPTLGRRVCHAHPLGSGEPAGSGNPDAPAAHREPNPHRLRLCQRPLAHREGRWDRAPPDHRRGCRNRSVVLSRRSAHRIQRAVRWKHRRVCHSGRGRGTPSPDLASRCRRSPGLDPPGRGAVPVGKGRASHTALAVLHDQCGWGVPQGRLGGPGV
jgi:hypothetical protein